MHYTELVFHNRGVPLELGDLCREFIGEESEVMSECCKVGYSAMMARAHVHNFKF